MKKIFQLFLKGNKHIGLLASVVSALLAVAILLVSCSPDQPSAGAKEAWPEFYAQAGTITVKDPMASLVGSLPYGEEEIHISLTDVAKYTGHVCVGVASGFVLTKMSLEKLYPGEVPQRGQIKVQGNCGHDILDVASYITGARSQYGRGELNRDDLSIDEKLGDCDQQKIVVFERKDNGKKVRAVFNSSKIVPPEKRKKMDEKMDAILAGKASEIEKNMVAKNIQGKVEQVLSGKLSDAISVMKE